MARWYNVVCQEVFNLWRLMHQRCVPMTARPVDEALGKSRDDRRAGARQGACKYSVPTIGGLGQVQGLKGLPGLPRFPGSDSSPRGPVAQKMA